MLDLESLTPREALGRALADLGDLRRDVVVLVADTGETTRASSSPRGTRQVLQRGHS